LLWRNWLSYLRSLVTFEQILSRESMGNAQEDLGPLDLRGKRGVKAHTDHWGSSARYIGVGEAEEVHM
jgi:hypothetical protein